MLLVPIVSVSGQLVIWFVKCLRDEKKRVKNNTTHKNNNNNNGNDNTNRCSRVNTKFRESCCVLNVVRYIQYARGEKKKERKRWEKRMGPLARALVRLGIKCHCVREYGRANREGKRQEGKKRTMRRNENGKGQPAEFNRRTRRPRKEIPVKTRAHAFRASGCLLVQLSRWCDKTTAGPLVVMIDKWTDSPLSTVH